MASPIIQGPLPTSVTSAPNKIPVADNDGHLDPNWIPGISAGADVILVTNLNASTLPAGVPVIMNGSGADTTDPTTDAEPPFLGITMESIATSATGKVATRGDAPVVFRSGLTLNTGDIVYVADIADGGLFYCTNVPPIGSWIIKLGKLRYTSDSTHGVINLQASMESPSMAINMSASLYQVG